jgi:galactokinase
VTLESLLAPRAVAAELKRSGIGPQAAPGLAGRFVRAAHALGAETPLDTPAFAFFVPGRVEVLGKHTDYAGGCSIVCAVERGFCLVAVPRTDRQVLFTALDYGETYRLDLADDLQPQPGHWSTYPLMVVRRLARNFPDVLKGCHLAFSSDLPRASGMSSSSAFVTAVFLAFRALNALERHPAYLEHIDGPEALAMYASCIENGRSFGALSGDLGVGTLGGSEDHVAILCSRPGALHRYTYAPIRHDFTVPFPDGHVFVIGASGIEAPKTGRAQQQYNRAAQLADEVVNVWRQDTGLDAPHLAAAIASPAFSRGRMQAALRASARPGFPKQDLYDRFEHFYCENEDVIPAASAALQSDDLAAFGIHVDRSQRYAERLLKNQISETTFLARAARASGAVAASAFGAGFGGSVWALVPEVKAETFREAWKKHYHAAFPDLAAESDFFLTRSGPAAFALEL